MLWLILDTSMGQHIFNEVDSELFQSLERCVSLTETIPTADECLKDIPDSVRNSKDAWSSKDKA